MRVLLYKDLDLRRVKPAFAKVRAAIEAGDFRSPDVKKLAPTRFWRAKLDDANRLLLQFARHGDETVCLALEVIDNHAYERSRFLRGATVDEAKIEREPAPADAAGVAAQAAHDAWPLRWLHPQRADFELLDKPIQFDETQQAVHGAPAPLVIVGSAGSGKTAVTLSRLRQEEGRVLYVTQSAYLAESARALHDAHGYENPAQEAEFLSYRELLETWRVPPGREVGFPAFRAWFDRHRASVRGALGDVDAHALFEEFRGVLGASPQGPLDLASYFALGARQSLLAGAAREAAHGLFQRYRQWLDEAGLFDLNLLAHAWRPLVEPTYDFIVVDEVQDLTAVQLALVLACLKKPGRFLLCGDSNQIVHPNFFSWAAVRALFWQGLAGDAAQRQAVTVLQANFRNTRAVTRLANDLLKIKQARFGSVDRESNFLVRSAGAGEGGVTLVRARDAELRALDAQSRASVHHAVVVLRDEDKAAAREHFRTPLVFSVHEAKGLEYAHVILFSLVSGHRAEYAEVCEGVTQSDLQVEELGYARARDKGDKSLELYKFYVNALYVAMTRAVETLVLVESDAGHPLLQLLGLQVDAGASIAPAARASSREEWAQEAHRLELQGKTEQASAIRETFLQSKPVPWTPWSEALLREQMPLALDRRNPSNKPRQALLDYALWHGQQAFANRLANEAGFQPALGLMGLFGSGLGGTGRGSVDDDPRVVRDALGWRACAVLRQRHLQPYAAHNFKDLLRQCEVHGIDHQRPTGGTTLQLAARAGNVALVEALLERGADPEQRDEFGHTPWWAAVNRALDEPAFGARALGPLFDRIGPAVLDVQTGDRLVRLERHQAEYWVLTVMLAGFKTLCSTCVPRDHPRIKYEGGYFAEMLQGALEQLPPHLWVPQRRKRSYVNSVLARAEVDSEYRPARQLWLRVGNGRYMPNPLMQLRPRAGGDAGWTPVYELLNLAWVSGGTASPASDAAGELAVHVASARVWLQEREQAREQVPAG